MIAVLGASGEIGCRLVQRLLEDGVPVRALSRRPHFRLLRWGNLDFRRVDLRHADSLTQAMDGADAVINCAVDKQGTEQPQRVIDNNVRAMESLLQAVEACRTPSLIHLSSIAVAPPRLTDENVRGNVWSGETDWYTRSKLLTEQLLLAHPAAQRTAIVRGGVVYGPFMDWSRGTLERLKYITLVLPDDAGYCPAVHVDDLVGLLLHLATLEPPFAGRLWGINPELVTWRTFFESHAALSIPGERALVSGPLPPPGPPPPSPPRSRMRAVARKIGGALFRSVLPRPLRELSAVQRYYQRRRSRHLAPPYQERDGVRPFEWPDGIEVERLRSTAQFQPCEVGSDQGFPYRVPFAEGMRSVAQWYRWDYQV